MGLLAAGAAKADDGSPGAVLFECVDTYHKPITTGSAEAQAWFDQGLPPPVDVSAWHDESCRECWNGLVGS